MNARKVMEDIQAWAVTPCTTLMYLRRISGIFNGRLFINFQQIFGNQTMLPILMYDAVILYANAARNIIISLKEYQHPYKRCDLGRYGRSSWLVGRLIVKEMKEVTGWTS